MRIFHDNYERNGKNFNNFSDTFKAQKPSEKIKKLNFVRNPRDNICYFEEEMFTESFSSNAEKYRYLIGTRPKEELSVYSIMTKWCK